MSLATRVLRNVQAEYERGIYEGSNGSGVIAIGTHLLILTDKVAETTSGEAGAATLAAQEQETGEKIPRAEGATLHGIRMPQHVIDQMNLASETGVIIGIGDAAFRYYDDGSRWDGRKPEVGDRVFFERYAGRELLGADGRMYRLMTYTCIAGIEAPAESEPAPCPSPEPSPKPR